EPCHTDFLAARLAVALSKPFADAHPDIVAFFERVQFEPDLLNAAILEMTEQRISGSDMAERFLNNNPQAWRSWLDAAQAARLEASLGGAIEQADNGMFLQWSGADFVNRHLTQAVKRWGETFRQMGDVLLVRVLLPVENFSMAVPAWV